MGSRYFNIPEFTRSFNSSLQYPIVNILFTARFELIIYLHLCKILHTERLCSARRVLQTVILTWEGESWAACSNQLQWWMNSRNQHFTRVRVKGLRGSYKVKCCFDFHQCIFIILDLAALIDRGVFIRLKYWNFLSNYVICCLDRESYTRIH